MKLRRIDSFQLFTYLKSIDKLITYFADQKDLPKYPRTITSISMNDLKLDTTLISTQSIEISASPDKVWKILTEPAWISQYLFGAETVTDWKPGSTIQFKINFENQEFIDKGIVVESNEFSTLKYRYWSGFCGLEDKPDNYSIVSYHIGKIDSKTSKLTWSQIGFVDEDSRSSSENSLATILDQIKTFAESLV